MPWRKYHDLQLQKRGPKSGYKDRQPDPKACLTHLPQNHDGKTEGRENTVKIPQLDKKEMVGLELRWWQWRDRKQQLWWHEAWWEAHGLLGWWALVTGGRMTGASVGHAECRNSFTRANSENAFSVWVHGELQVNWMKHGVKAWNTFGVVWRALSLNFLVCKTKMLY